MLGICLTVGLVNLYLFLDGSEVWHDVLAVLRSRGVHSAVLVQFVDTAELDAAKLEKLDE